VTLPAARGGASGGSAPTETNGTRGKQRRVEEVAPVVQAPNAKQVIPKMTEASQSPKPPQQAKGTNLDTTSRGTATTAAKTKKDETPAKTVVPGTAGTGGGSGLGKSSGIPGLKASRGVMGGTGLLQEFIGASDFPLWYAQQVQDSVTRNWIQLRGGEGRVQIYFRILRTGKIEAARIEISSGKGDLDDLALQAVKRTTLPRLPEELEGDSLGVRFWFNYSQ
jgi:TonB family protein